MNAMLILCLMAIGLLSAELVFRMYRRELDGAVKEEFEHFTRMLEAHRSKLAEVQRGAVEYYSSFDGRSTKLLLAVQEMLTEVEAVRAGLESLIVDGSYDALKTANQILNHLKGKGGSQTEFSGQLVAAELGHLNRWSEKVELPLSVVCMALSKAQYKHDMATANHKGVRYQ